MTAGQNGERNNLRAVPVITELVITTVCPCGIQVVGRMPISLEEHGGFPISFALDTAFKQFAPMLNEHVENHSKVTE